MFSAFTRRQLLKTLPAAAAAASPFVSQGQQANTGKANAQDPNLVKHLQIPRAEKPAKEIRAIWIHPETTFAADEKTGRQQVQETVQRYARAGFNLILPWTVSGYLTALDHSAYQKKHPTAAWNSLGLLIEEASKEGIDVDMWYSFTDYRQVDSPEFDPAVGGNRAWAAKRIEEVVPNPATGKVEDPSVDNVCPQHYEARAWMLQQVESVLQRYPKLHGLHIEEPGYRQRGYCLCDLCQSLFQQMQGKKLTENLDTAPAEDLRTIGTSAFMAELRDGLKKNHPKLVLSVNGGPDWRHDRLRGRDWGRWAQAGWLRYYATQVYVSDTASFREQLGVTMNDISRECQVVAGISINWSEGRNTLQEVIRQIEASRELGAAGVALFHGKAFSDEDLRAIKAGPFQRPA